MCKSSPVSEKLWNFEELANLVILTFDSGETWWRQRLRNCFAGWYKMKGKHHSILQSCSAALTQKYVSVFRTCIFVPIRGQPLFFIQQWINAWKCKLHLTFPARRCQKSKGQQGYSWHLPSDTFFWFLAMWSLLDWAESHSLNQNVFKFWIEVNSKSNMTHKMDNDDPA